MGQLVGCPFLVQAMYEISNRFEFLAEEVIDEHPDLQWIRRANVSIGYIECDQEKNKASGRVFGECILVKELYQLFCCHDFLIVVYTPNVIRMTEDQLKILLYHELLHVDMSEKDGRPKYRIAPHDVEDFRSVIERYGMNWAGV